MPDDKPKKRGRPTSYKPEYCQQVIALGEQGKSQHQISAALGKPLSTIRSWADVHEDFSQALTRAKELEQVWWEDVAQENLTNKGFNAHLWLKNVASRFREAYGEKAEHVLTGKDGGPIKMQDVGDKELARRLALVLARGAHSKPESDDSGNQS